MTADAVMGAHSGVPARRWRLSLAQKLAVAFLGLVAAVLVINGAIDMAFTYSDARAQAVRVQQEKANAASDRVTQFVTEIEQQLGWTTRAEWARISVEQRRYDFIRLMRQAAAITELVHVDGAGREQLKLSRLEPDSVSANADLSADPRFVAAVRDRSYFGPVTFRRGSEPYMTIAIAHAGRNAGVTIAEVNLKLAWDVVTAISVGETGYAYIADPTGRLIAHPDMSLVLRNTNLSALPQVASAMARDKGPSRVDTTRGPDGRDVLSAHAVVPKVGWIVFVELPAAEALGTVWAALHRTLVLLGLGVLLAGLAGIWLARRMLVPITELQAGAQRLGAGDLSLRVPVRTGDEIGALAERFNTMAGQIQESQETLEAKVQERTVDLNRSLAQQTATADVLKAISRSAFDLKAVLDTLVQSAARLCGADFACIFQRHDDLFHWTAQFQCPPELVAYGLAHPFSAGTQSVTARVALERRPVQVADALNDPDYKATEFQRLGGYRTILGVPLLREGAPTGVFIMARNEVRPFNERQIELLQTFADQAVIAIENTRLFDEVQARTRDVEEALRYQKAIADVLGVISRSPSDVAPVLDAIAGTALDLCGALDATVLLTAGDVLRRGAYRGGLSFGRMELPLTRDYVAGRAVVDAAPVQVDDLLAAGDEYPLGLELAKQMGFRTAMAVPLMRDGAAVGCLLVRRDRIDPFSERQIELLRTFADQAVIAIGNARLFEEVQARTKDLQDSLDQQTATADVLKVISRSVFDLDAVLNALLETAVKLCNAATGGIYRVDPDGYSRIMSSYMTGDEAFRKAALDYAREHPSPVSRASLTGRVALEKAVVQIPDFEADAEYGDRNKRRVGDHLSGIGAPLMRNGDVFAVLVLGRPTAGLFSPREVELLSTFADQAVIAIENARLFEEVQARTQDLQTSLEQQTATGEVLKVISRSAFDLDTVFTTLIETAGRLCGADRGTIFLRDGDLLAPAAIHGMPEATRVALLARPLLVDESSAGGRCVLTRAVVNVSDVEADPLYRRADLVKVSEYRSIIGVPLMKDGEAIGAFSLPKREPGGFTPRQIELLQTFADQAVIAIGNTRLFEEVQERTRELSQSLDYQTATSEVLQVISRSAFDLPAVFDTLLRSACGLCEAEHGIVWVRRGDLFHAEASFGVSGDYLAFLQAHPQRKGDPTTPGLVAAAASVVHIPDKWLEPGYRPPNEVLKYSDTRTLLGVPMFRESEVVGVFTLMRVEPRPFVQREIDLMRTFADQAVIAIENTRLFEEVQARTKDLQDSLDQQTATADVLKVISRSVFDLDAVLRTLIDTAVRLCGGSRGTIFMRRDDTLVASAFHSNVSPALRDALLARRFKLSSDDPEGGFVAESVRTGHIVHLPDLTADPSVVHESIRDKAAFGAVLVVPLLRDGEAIGCFAMPRNEPGPYSAREIELVKTFADQAVIAIENARLFEEVQERTRDLQDSLDQQTATSEVLQAISRSAFDLPKILQTLLDSAKRLCNIETTALYLLRDDRLYLEASTVDRPEWVAFKRANPTPLGRSVPSARAALTGLIDHVPDILADPELETSEDLHRLGGYRATLNVPLTRQGQVLGVLSLARDAVGEFTPRQIELARTFADQAVIAIENGRLFEEVQAKTHELEDALEQQTATSDVLKVISRSAFDLDSVLSTLVRSAAELCGVAHGLIFVRNGAEYTLGASLGFSAETEAFFRANPRRPGRESIVPRVLLSGQVEQIPDILTDAEYALPLTSDPNNPNHVRALFGVPLLRDGDIEGVFVLARIEPGRFADRQVELVKTFADQAVIAIGNTRLFEEVQAKTHELEASLADLTAAQTRLIQSEKLASLGQLTAGIAHEIKNPLNFVNNFADLSSELVGEIEDALTSAGDALNPEIRAEVDDLAGMLKGNLAKIVQHGRRADSIVKNMLAHSRESGGERRMVDINATVEEALNLAYHGARAEKPGFNITLERDFDPAAGQMELYPQEFTRVLLNLIGNGFHAANKKRTEAAVPGFEPTLRVTTKADPDTIAITVRDNGTGIPDAVKARIFEPFFTTKPTGEGTGLGLSLSHDIVVKQHGGKLDVATEPGEFTEFSVTLPRKTISQEAQP